MFQSRLAPAVPVTTTGAYEFMASNGSTPVTYDPCKPIRYELNMTHAPAGAEGILGAAIQEVERATGLRFEYVGTTSRRPLDRAPKTFSLGPSKVPPVVIAWATEAEAPLLAGDVAGYAGSSYMTIDGRSHFTTGQVILDSDAYKQLVQDAQGSAQARAITMHELAHLVGLSHVDDPTELMYSQNVGQLEFGPGDRAGLALLGQGRCR